LALDPLLILARETGCHVLLVHHASKADREGLDQILGSTAIGGCVDAGLILRRDESGLRTLTSIQRCGTDLPETILAMDRFTRRVALGGLAATQKLAVAERRILDTLKDKSLSEPDIKDAVGGNRGDTGKVLRKLYKAGRVTRTGAGKKGDPYTYQVAVISCDPGAENSMPNARFSPTTRNEHCAALDIARNSQADDYDEAAERAAIADVTREDEEAAGTRRDTWTEADPPELLYGPDGEVIGVIEDAA